MCFLLSVFFFFKLSSHYCFWKFSILSILGFKVLYSGPLNSYFSYVPVFPFQSKLSTSSSFTCISYFQLEGDILGSGLGIFHSTMRIYNEGREIAFLQLWPSDQGYQEDHLEHLKCRCLGFIPDLLKLKDAAQ